MSIEKNYRPEDYAKAMSETYGAMKAFDMACEAAGEHRTGRPYRFWSGVRDALREEATALQCEKHKKEEEARKLAEAVRNARVDAVVEHIKTLGYTAEPDYINSRVIVGLSING